MPILPLPQFEADLKVQLAEEDRKVYESLQIPKSIVVRFGAMKLVGEFPYDGKVKPGCGSKVVVRTHRGTELGEMLTSTCPNGSCSKSVSRQEMLQYINNSGGRDYPFFQEGRVLRLATPEDLDKQAAVEQRKHEIRIASKQIAERLALPLKIVDAEPILGGELLTIHYTSEERVELRDLFRELSQRLNAKIDLKHCGARDEARLTADYEKCGQYCCCKNFLKVLKPISMKSAKTQKATLDPLKISGRCGRLMCCLRYEDETYEDLRKRLPRKKTRVGTPEGDGLVLDGQILTQLVLIELDALGTDGRPRQVAVPVEDITPAVSQTPPVRPEFPMRDLPPRRGPGGPPRPAPPAAPRGPAPAAGAPSAAQPQSRPPARPPQGEPRDRRDRPPQRRDGGPPPSDRGQRPPAPPPASKPPQRDEVDDLMASMEDDWGDGARPAGPSGGPAGGPPGGSGGPDGPRGKRRRRRRGGGPRGPGGNEPGPPGPA